MSPSDAELSSAEPTACYDRRITAGEEDGDGGPEEISKNGQEVTEAVGLDAEATEFLGVTQKHVTGGAIKM